MIYEKNRRNISMHSNHLTHLLMWRLTKHLQEFLEKGSLFLWSLWRKTLENGSLSSCSFWRKLVWRKSCDFKTMNYNVQDDSIWGREKVQKRHWVYTGGNWCTNCEISQIESFKLHHILWALYRVSKSLQARRIPPFQLDLATSPGFGHILAFDFFSSTHAFNLLICLIFITLISICAFNHLAIIIHLINWHILFVISYWHFISSSCYFILIPLMIFQGF